MRKQKHINSGGTIRERALFFQTVAAGGGGALFKRGHYSLEYGIYYTPKSQPTQSGQQTHCWGTPPNHKDIH